MPSLLCHRSCPLCGRAHSFCLAVGDISTGQRFDFRCPRTDKSGLLEADAAGEVTRSYVQGAVALTRSGVNQPMAAGPALSGATMGASSDGVGIPVERFVAVGGSAIHLLMYQMIPPIAAINATARRARRNRPPPPTGLLYCSDGCGRLTGRPSLADVIRAILRLPIRPSVPRIPAHSGGSRP
jgi:hypothetical protein